MRAIVPGIVTSLLLGSALLVGSTTGCGSTQEREEIALTDSNFHYQLAVGHYQAREIPTAIGELLASLEIAPTNAHSLFLLGFIYHGRRDLHAAEQYYLEALDSRPEWAEVLNNLGTVYLEQERWDEAVEIFTRLTRNPTYVTPGHAHNNLGWAYYNLGMASEALDQFELAVMFQPEHCLAHNNEGMILLERGDRRNARRALERAIELCDDYAEPRYRLGVLLLDEAGEHARAFELFQECYDQSPRSGYGERCQEYLTLGAL